MKITISAVTICLLVFTMGTFAQQETFQELYEEYMELNQKLQMVQQQALADEKVSAEAEKYSDYVDSVVQQMDEKAANLIKERDKTLDEFEAAQEKGDYESFPKIQQDYERISSELAPYFERAMMNEEVIGRRTQFEDMLLAKMEEIDPDTRLLIDRLYEVAEKLEKMMEEPE